jgi:nucleoside-diphosphate-sugar epimerase
MNILITGATGFIGGHLSQILATRCKVFGLTRNPPKSSNFNWLPVIADLSDSHFAESLPTNIDCVIHLAQSAGYRDFPEGSQDMLAINIDATAKLLEWARSIGVKQFIFTSTANVYEKSNQAFTESHSTQPNSFYGASKLAAEYLVKQYHHYFQVDILRCFTVYGPGQTSMLIPNVIERINAGVPITLAGGIGIYLTPIHIRDFGMVIERILSLPITQEVRLMNVCGEERTNLSEIIKIAGEIMGRPAVIEIVDDDTAYFMGNNERLMGYLTNHHFLDIRCGLESVIHQSAIL